jgi:DNA-binding LacI/PurR family transcriptional regulator
VEIAAFSYETQLAVPPYCLTHAYQSGEEMGTQAAQLLFGRIQNPNVAARTVEIPMQLSDPACGEQQAFVIMTEQA